MKKLGTIAITAVASIALYETLRRSGLIKKAETTINDWVDKSGKKIDEIKEDATATAKDTINDVLDEAKDITNKKLD